MVKITSARKYVNLVVKLLGPPLRKSDLYRLISEFPCFHNPQQLFSIIFVLVFSIWIFKPFYTWKKPGCHHTLNCGQIFA